MLERIIKILKDQILISDDQEVKESSRLLEDLGLDSLDQMVFMMAMEKEYDISMRDDDSVKIKTISDCIEWVVYSINKLK